MLARARWMGHDLGRPHVLLAVSLEELADRESGSQRLQATDLVRTEVLRLAPGRPAARAAGPAAVALPRSAPPTSEEALDLAERRKRIASLLASGHVTVGVGRHHPGIGGLALSTARRSRRSRSVGRCWAATARSTSSTLGVQRLLFQLRDNPSWPRFMTTCSASSRRTTSARAPSWSTRSKRSSNATATTSGRPSGCTCTATRCSTAWTARNGARRGPGRRRDAPGAASCTKDRPRIGRRGSTGPLRRRIIGHPALGEMPIMPALNDDSADRSGWSSRRPPPTDPFVNLQFTDIMGLVKTVSMPSPQARRRDRPRLWFDGSSVEGFARIHESDMYLQPIFRRSARSRGTVATTRRPRCSATSTRRTASRSTATRARS